MSDIYCAGPFFNSEQVKVMDQIEKALEEHGLDYYSPRKDGVLIEMTPEERKASTKKIFDRNVAEIAKAKLILAVIDGRDVGTTWEIGFAYAISIPIITFSSYGFGVNVMIKECVWAHVKGMERLREVLSILHNADVIDLPVTVETFSQFQDFSEDVT